MNTQYMCHSFVQFVTTVLLRVGTFRFNEFRHWGLSLLSSMRTLINTLLQI